MSEIIPFDFEEQAVRVLMRDGDPWFVAADVCRVLELGNPSQAISRLDDDEVTLISNEGNHRPTNLVSESGLYALVLGSRKEAARRFRKWITAEVLPAIRRTGRYEFTPAAPERTMCDDIQSYTVRDCLYIVRQVERLFGAKEARTMYRRLPLPQPQPGPNTIPAIDPAEARACLDYLLAADIEGQTVSGWIDEGIPSQPVADGLARAGLRVVASGLFVANATTVFAGSRWAGGLHKLALMVLPGVTPDTTPRTLAGQHSRGIIVPFALIEGGVNA